MVVDALEYIAGLFGIEKTQWQAHEFYPEIGEDGNVYMGAYIKQNTAADKLYHGAPKEQSKLGNKDNINKLQVMCVDARIYNDLCKERKDELQ